MWLNKVLIRYNFNPLLELDIGLPQNKQDHLDENHPMHIRSAHYLKCEFQLEEYVLKDFLKWD